MPGVEAIEPVIGNSIAQCICKVSFNYTYFLIAADKDTCQNRCCGAEVFAVSWSYGFQEGFCAGRSSDELLIPGISFAGATPLDTGISFY